MIARAAALAIAAALALAAGCNDPVPPRPPGVLVVSQEQQASWIRNFNPLLPDGLSRWPSSGGIYEPLLIFSTTEGRYVPWLATDYAWGEGARELRVTLRHGVRWSDGAPFTAADVDFTYRLMKKFPALDVDGIWTFLEAVEVTGADTVVFRFQRPYAPGLYYVGQQPIVPEHVWRNVADPVTWPNPSPIATGPFTEVEVFESQVYQLGRNPYYWQGRTGVASLRFPALSSNEQANLALINGEIDWAGNFVPAIDRIYVGADPAHHRYWFPLLDGAVMIYPNTKRPPLDDPRVRKALSLAIDRALVVDVALYGYSRPSDPTGLDDGFGDWRDPEAAAAGWTAHDPAAAGRLLDEAGCKRGADGVRVCPSGRLELPLQTVSGWSDWMRAAQVIARDLQKIGVDATVRSYDFSAWFDRLQRGDYDLSMGWTEPGPTPHAFYRALLASDTVQPIGTPAPRNWHRFGDPEADALLHAFEATVDPTEQRRLAHGIERRFAATAPVIPLYSNPSWAEFSVARFDGFADAAHPYARPTPNRQPECLLVLTRLAPRQASR